MKVQIIWLASYERRSHSRSIRWKKSSECWIPTTTRILVKTSLSLRSSEQIFSSMTLFSKKPISDSISIKMTRSASMSSSTWFLARKKIDQPMPSTWNHKLKISWRKFANSCWVDSTTAVSLSMRWLQGILIKSPKMNSARSWPPIPIKSKHSFYPNTRC